MYEMSRATVGLPCLVCIVCINMYDCRNLCGESLPLVLV